MFAFMHTVRHKVWLVLMTLCLSVCLVGGSIGVLTTSDAQENSAGSVTGSQTEQIETSATDNQGRNYWDYSANGSNVYDGSMQTFTAPITAKYMLQAWGASGGGSAGGYGAYSVSYVDLTAGNTVLILVGKAGAQGGNTYCGGGGGGTFFALGSSYTSATPLCVAGGGGGGQCNGQAALSTNNHGMATQAGGTTTDNTSAPSVGYGGIKGCASSGGGFYGNGTTGTYGSFGYGFRQGGQGGSKTDSSAYGGYGGGGSTHGNCGGAPGGGGYTGGNATSGDHTGVLGGGGGSYYTGTYNGVSGKAIGGGGAIPSRTINSTATVSGKQGNGFARITQLNSPPKNSSTPTHRLVRGNSASMTMSAVAVDTDATNDSISFSAYSNNVSVWKASDDSSASALLTSTFTNTGNTHKDNAQPTLTVSPKQYFAKTQFYFKAKDNHGAEGKIYFYVEVADQGVTAKASGKAYEATGAEGNYQAGAEVGTAWRSATSGDEGTYNTTGQVVAGVQTLFLNKPVSRGADGNAQKVLINIGDLYADADNRSSPYTSDEVLIKAAQKHNSADGTYNIKLQNAVGGYYRQLVIETNPNTTNQGQYSSILLTYVTRENGGSNHVAANDAANVCRIVFKVDNTRPTLKAGKVVQIKAGESERVALTSFVTDLDGNDMTLASTGASAVVIPEYEFIQVDKYDKLVTGEAATAANTYYNKSSTGSAVTQAFVDANKTEIHEKGYASVAGYETGFGQELIAAEGDTSKGETYATFGVSADRREITITGKHATRSQYKATRGGTLGHYYILLHIVDAGEEEDEGIWMPLGIEILNSAPTATVTGKTTYELNVGDSLYFSPIGGYGQWLDADGTTYHDAESYAFATDVDEFEQKGSTARNSFLYFEYGNPASNTLWADTGAYLKLDWITLYAEKATAAKLTAHEKELLGMTETGDKVTFRGIKITGVQSTLQTYAEIELTVGDTMRSTDQATQTLAFCVENRAPKLRETLGSIDGVGKWETDAQTKEQYAHYEVYNSTTFTITPYEFATDADMADAAKNMELKAFSQAYEGGVAVKSDSVRALYAQNNRVKARSTAEGTGQERTLGNDTLRYLFEEGEVSGSFGYKDYMDVTYVPASDGVYPHLRITVNRRTTVGNPLKFTLKIADSAETNGEADHAIEIAVRVDIMNREPRLKTGKGLFEISADTSGGIAPKEPQAGALYNVLEYEVGELVTDPDMGDDNNLAYYDTTVRVFTRGADGAENEEAAKGYIEAAILASGSGSRLGRAVLYVKAKSSTQALQGGLYVEFSVTDKFGSADAGGVSVTRLTIQIEVIDSAPIMAGDTKFQTTADGEKVWDITPQNAKNTIDRRSTRYIAGSARVYEYLTTGTTDAAHVTTLAKDNDGRQSLQLATGSSEAIPTFGSIDEGWGQSNAILYSKVYGEDTEKNLGLEILYYTAGADGNLTAIDPSADNFETLFKADALEWAIAITPRQEYSVGDTLRLQIRVRDNTAEGGDTKGQQLAYRGVRGENPNVVVTARSTFEIGLQLKTIGFTNNITAYESGYGANAGNYYLYDDRTYEGLDVSDPTTYPYNSYPYIYSDSEQLAADQRGDLYKYGTVEVQKTGTAYVPISYLGIPANLSPNKTQEVSFASGYGAQQDVLLEDVRLTDGTTTWQGDRLNDNPYVTIDLSDEEESFTSSRYCNKNLYYFDETKTPKKLTESIAEDKYGLTLTKKSLRSNGELTVTVRLKRYSMSGGNATPDDTSMQEVRFKVTVENDFLNVNKNRTQHHEFDENKTTPREVNLKGGSNESGILEEDVTLSSGDVTVRLLNDTHDGATAASNKTSVNLLYATEKDYYVDKENVTYKEDAYYLARSVTGRLTAEDVARMLTEKNGALAYTNETKERVRAFLGDGNGLNIPEAVTGEWIQSNLAAINAQLNPKYGDYFSVIPSGTDTGYLTIRPTRKTQPKGLDTMSDADLYATYGLKRKTDKDNVKRYYYPLRTVVYDDWRGTGWENSSYQIVQLNVYVMNAAPTVAAGNADPTDANNRIYKLEIEKEGTATFNLVDVVKDADMTVNTATRRYRAESGYTTDLDKKTRDWLPTDNAQGIVNGVKLESQPQSGDVTVSLDTYSQITFTAHERLAAGTAARFTMSFYDSTMTRSKETLTFEITVGNKAPEVYTMNNSPITNELLSLDHDITLKAGDYFTVIATPWDTFVTGAGTAAEITTQAALKSKVDGDTAGKLPNTYRMYFDAGNSVHTNKTLSENGLYEKLTESNLGIWANKDSAGGTYGLRTAGDEQGVAGNAHDRGYLPLSSDDTPWGLRFASYNMPTMYRERLTVAPIDVLPNDRGQQETGAYYSLGYRITAKQACSGVSMQFTITDGEQPALTVKVNIRVTVISSPPVALDFADKQEFHDPEWTLENKSNAEYVMTMYQGDTVRLNVNRIAKDEDTNETLTLDTSAGGQVFTVDNAITNVNRYVRLNAYGTYLTVTGLNVTGADASYSTVTFKVVDGSNLPNNYVTVTLRIRVAPRKMTGKAVETKYEVKSVREYIAESVPDTLNMFAGADAAFEDPDSTADTIAYDLNIYALCDENGSRLTLTSDKKESQKIATYTNGALTLSDTAVARYLATYFTPGVTEGGRTLTFIPKRMSNGVLPIRVEATKQLLYPDGSFSQTETADYAIQVANSAVEAVGNTPLNYGYLQPDTAYLTYTAHVGETVKYAVVGEGREDFGLFKDVDIRKENGADTGDLVTVREKDIRVLEEYGNLKTTAGWQADGELACVYDASVENGAVTIRINRKLTDKENAKAAGVLLLEVTGRDSQGTETTTVITIYVQNTAPAFKAFEGETYSSTYGRLAEGVNGYSVDLTLRAGQSQTLTLSDVLEDVDLVGGNYATEQFSFLPVSGAESLNIVAISGDPEARHTVKDASGNDLATVRVSDANNSKLIVDSVSTTRDAQGEIWLHVSDGAGARTAEPLRVRMTIANSAPYIKKDVDTTIRLLSKNSGVNDAERLDILDFIGDDNLNDLDATGASRTYLRITGIEIVPVDDFVEAGDGSGESSEEDLSGKIVECRLDLENNPCDQKFIIRPVTGRYGRQTVRIYATDDGKNNLADAVSVTLTLSVQVSRDPSTLTLNNIDALPWKTRTDEITPKWLLTDFNTAKDYSLGYEIRDIRLSEADQKKLTIVKEEDEAGTHWYVFADERTAERVQLHVYFNVAGQELKEPMIFLVSVSENTAPVFKTDFSTDRMIYRSDLTNDVVRYKVEDMFVDNEGDDIVIQSAVSSQNYIVEASVENNELVLNFKARGSATITMQITDATGRSYERKIVVQNPDLPKVNAFVAFIIMLQENVLLFSLIGAGILLLIIILLIIIAVVRHKKRVQAEVEALLVSEMQIEEQMMKLAAAQNAMNTYALPPTTPAADPNLMLGASPDQPNPNAALGLNAPPPNLDDFDDNEF